MSCSHKRKDISRIVLEVLRHIHGDPTIVEATVFGAQGLNVDAMFRGSYFFPIKMSVEKVDCLIKKFSPADCEQAKAVSDIVFYHLADALASSVLRPGGFGTAVIHPRQLIGNAHAGTGYEQP